MTALAESRSARPTLSPAARALRLQRIFARLQEGASYKDIAAEEGLSRERLRQIVRAGIARGGAKCSATIWMGKRRRSGELFWRSRRDDDGRGATIAQAIFREA